jgi:hypothetical protein
VSLFLNGAIQIHLVFRIGHFGRVFLQRPQKSKLSRKFQKPSISCLLQPALVLNNRPPALPWEGNSNFNPVIPGGCRDGNFRLPLPMRGLHTIPRAWLPFYKCWVKISCPSPTTQGCRNGLNSFYNVANCPNIIKIKPFNTASDRRIPGQWFRSGPWSFSRRRNPSIFAVCGPGTTHA